MIARQVARYELIRAAACVKPGCCTTAAFLKRRIHGALQHYLRDYGRPVRVSRREHEKGIHPWGHQSLDAHDADERPFLDKLASPVSEEPAAAEGLGVSAEALLQRLPAHEAAILRLWVLQSRSLRSIAAELVVSVMTVNRHEKAALAALREQLARAPAGAGQPAPISPPALGADTRLIQVYLRHRNIQHTVRYTATNPARFEKLWG